MEKAKIIGLKNLKKMLLQWHYHVHHGNSQCYLQILCPADGHSEEISIFAYLGYVSCASYCTKRGANIIVDALMKAKYPKSCNFLFLAQSVSDGIFNSIFIYLWLSSLSCSDKGRRQCGCNRYAIMDHLPCTTCRFCKFNLIKEISDVYRKND